MAKKKVLLKIGIVLPSIVSMNGTAKQSVEMAKTLSERGHDVHFYTFAYSKRNSFPDFTRFTVHHVIDSDSFFLSRFIKRFSLLEYAYLCYAFLFLPRFRKLFRNQGLHIVNPHDWFSIWVVCGLPPNVTIVANINDVPLRQNHNVVSMIKLAIDRYCSPKIAAIVVLDYKNKEKVLSWLQCPQDKIYVLRSGIDRYKYRHFDKTIDVKKKLGIPKSSFVAVCANLLATNRKYEDVIGAMATLGSAGRRIHFLILSKLDYNVSYAHYLRALARTYNLMDRVHFIDKYFTDKERMLYIKSSDVLIFPNCPQTWGLTVLEAMALSVPVIVSSCSGVSEVLHDNVDSLVYKSGDIHALGEKVSFFLNNKDIRRTIAARGKQYVLSKFSWNDFGKNMERVMMRSLGNTYA